MAWADTYTTTYRRALISYHGSGFLSRELDADDYDFIEHVKKCGVANGELPYTNAFILQELDYWHLPYGIDYTVHRRVGVEKEPKSLIPDAAAAARRARWARDKADRAATKQAMKEEWERQQQELAAEREKNLRRTMQADKEWERDWKKEDRDSYDYYQMPKKDRPPSDRHYIPFWKREELRREMEAQAELEAEARARAKAAKKAKRQKPAPISEELDTILEAKPVEEVVEEPAPSPVKPVEPKPITETDLLGLKQIINERSLDEIGKFLMQQQPDELARISAQLDAYEAWVKCKP